MMSDSTIGIVACFTTVILWTIGTFAFAKASRMSAPAAVNRVRLLYALILLSIITCISQAISPVSLFTIPSNSQFTYFGLSGLIGFSIGDYFSFQAFRILGGRRTTIFTCIAPAAALLFGIVLLNEQLVFMGIVGMVISIGGVLMLSLSRKEQEEVHNDGHGHFFQGVSFAIIGAACQGVGLVLSKKGFAAEGATIGAFHATWIRLGIGTFSAYLMGLTRVPLWRELVEMTKSRQTFFPVMLGTIVGPVLGVSASLVAVSHIEASVAQTILALTPVFVSVASVLFYKERLSFLSLVSVVVSLIGVVILVWRDAF